MFPLINITPPSTLVDVGFFSIGWYGVGYVVALAVLLAVTQRQLIWRGIDPAHLWNALLLVGILALIGGRLYHVIDQWQYYKDNLAQIVLPPYAGLGLYGGVAGAALGIFIYTRWKGLPLRVGLDVVIPGALLAQGIARWGNFFNQELYGPPTDAPWGIAIDCAHRVAQYPCSLYPEATTGFHPLFFYESALDITGGLLALYISWRFLRRLQLGDLAAFWAIWYGSTRFVLEYLRSGWNWTLGPLGGIPTAQVIGAALVLIGIVWLIYNHPRGKEPYPYPPRWEPHSPAPVDAEDDEEDAFDDEDEDGFDDEDDVESDPEHAPEATV